MALAETIGKWFDSAGAGVINSQHGLTAEEYEKAGVYIGVDPGDPVGDRAVCSVPLPAWNALVDEKLALQERLKAAADALRQIECQTHDGNYPLDICDQKAINTIALTGWREATK